MRLRKHFVLAAPAVVLLLVGTVFRAQVPDSERGVLSTDNYAKGEEKIEKGRRYEPAPF